MAKDFPSIITCILVKDFVFYSLKWWRQTQFFLLDADLEQSRCFWLGFGKESITRDPISHGSFSCTNSELSFKVKKKINTCVPWTSTGLCAPHFYRHSVMAHAKGNVIQSQNKQSRSQWLLRAHLVTMKNAQSSNKCLAVTGTVVAHTGTFVTQLHTNHYDSLLSRDLISQNCPHLIQLGGVTKVPKLSWPFTHYFGSGEGCSQKSFLLHVELLPRRSCKHCHATEGHITRQVLRVWPGPWRRRDAVHGRVNTDTLLKDVCTWLGDHNQAAHWVEMWWCCSWSCEQSHR